MAQRGILVTSIWLLLAFLSCNAQTMPVLKGHIEHSTSLSAETVFKPGNIFDRSKIPGLPGAGLYEWHRVPNWLAGAWHMDNENYYYVYDFLKKTEDTRERSESEATDTGWGDCKDREGNVWQQTKEILGKFMLENTMLITIPRCITETELAAKTFTEKRMFLKVFVDLKTAVINSTELAETIQTYKRVDANTVRCDSSAEVFNAEGQPAQLEKSFVVLHRTQTFKEVYDLSPPNEANSALFKYFLKSRGKQQLIPE